MIPVFGGVISSNLENAISDIVYNVVQKAIEDLGSSQNRRLIDEISDMTIDTILSEEGDEELNEVAKNILVEGLEVIMEQVKIHQWKVKFNKAAERSGLV